MMLGAVLGLVAAMVFYFGAPKSAGLQVLATLMLLASLIFFILPADLSPSSAIQAILKQTPNRRRPPVSTTISCIAVLFVVVSTMGYMTYGMFTRVSLYIAEQEWPSTDATVVSWPAVRIGSCAFPDDFPPVTTAVEVPPFFHHAEVRATLLDRKRRIKHGK